MNKSPMCYLVYRLLLTVLLTISSNLSASEVNIKKEEIRTIYYGATAASNRGLDKQDSEIGLAKAMSEILKNKHFKVDLKVYPSKEALFRDLDNNKLDGFWGTGLEALERIDILMEPMISKKIKGVSIKQPYLLLAKKQDGADSILQLKSKKLVLPVFSDIETLYLNTQLLKIKQPEIKQFFDYLPEVRNANLAIMDVYFGRADVTMVKLQDYQTALNLNPQVSSQIKVIEQSPAYLITAGCATKKNDKSEVIPLLESVMENAKNPETKGFLSLINADALEYIGYNDFDSLASLLNEYKSLKKMSTKKKAKK